MPPELSPAKKAWITRRRNAEAALSPARKAWVTRRRNAAAGDSSIWKIQRHRDGTVTITLRYTGDAASRKAQQLMRLAKLV